MSQRRGAACQSNPGPAFRGRGIVQNVPSGSEKALDIRVGGAHLLHRKNVDVACSQPLAHALAIGGTNAVDID